MTERERSRGLGNMFRLDGQGPQMTREKNKCIEDVCARPLKTPLQGDGSETFSDLSKVTQLGNGRSF